MSEELAKERRELIKELMLKVVKPAYISFANKGFNEISIKLPSFYEDGADLFIILRKTSEWKATVYRQRCYGAMTPGDPTICDSRVHVDLSTLFTDLRDYLMKDLENIASEVKILKR